MPDGGAADGERVLEAMQARPGGRELAQLARERGDGALVGGAARDLLLGREPRELDVVVAADAEGFARELAARLGPAAAVSAHGRFGTASVSWPGGRTDVAERRAESYPAPGALPEVRAGSAEQDLLRRDFTVNAIAVPIEGEQRGSVLQAPGALEDLAAGVLRVMHERSFSDDPTRLMRLARYSARLRFGAEQHTAELAAGAIASGALDTVSRSRVGAELRLALAEPDPVAALGALASLGVLAAIDPRLRHDAPGARRTLALLPSDASAAVALLALLALPLASGERAHARETIFALLDPMEFPASVRDRAARSALDAPGLLAPLARGARPSRVREALADTPAEGVAIAAALAPPEQAPAAELAREWLARWRGVRLEITGDDLLGAGVAAGPEVGRRLEHALARKLDGDAQGREAELRAALEEDA